MGREMLMKIYVIIKSYIEENGYSPSIRELKNLASVKSISTIAYHLQKLEKKGFIKKKYKGSRGVTLTDKESVKNEGN
jgi:SOS-response transcriptional repressor LexA